MSRVAEALMFSEAFAKNAPHSMLDITKGGQMGYAPNLTEWVSNHPAGSSALLRLHAEPGKVGSESQGIG
jgi:hypothetical protein